MKQLVIIISLILIISMASGIILIHTRTDTTAFADETTQVVEVQNVTGRLDFAEQPSLEESVDITLTITPTIDLEDAVVQIQVPTPFTIQDASPGDYTLDDGIVSWGVEDLLDSDVQYYFSVTVSSESELAVWIGADVLVGDTSQGGAAIAVSITEHESVISETGAGVFWIVGPHDIPEVVEDPPLAVRLIWDPLTDAGITTTLVVSITNLTGQAQSYDGTLQLPQGWALNSGTTPWESSLSSGQSSIATFSVTSEVAAGPWEVAALVDLPATVISSATSQAVGNRG